MLHCHNKQLTLIQIWDIEWREKQDIVKSRLKNLLQQNKKIYARRCDIGTVAQQHQQLFFEQTHIQGYVSACQCYGLTINNELVACMSFKHIKETQWELLQ
jgi:hypothetical protein